MPGTPRKTVYYRRAKFSLDKKLSLQKILAEALEKQQLIRDRLEAMNSAATDFRVISDYKKSGAFFCGRLTVFERGGHQLVMEDVPDAKVLSLSAISPPNQNGKQQQFVPGVFYFCVIDNHVAIIQSAALKVWGFEKHLAWLLRSKTQLMEPEDGLVLVDEPKKATRERIRTSHVKSVRFARPLMEEVGPPPEERTRKGTGSMLFKASGPVMELLKTVIKKDEFERLNLMEGVSDSNIDVRIEIRYPKNFRVKSKSSASLKMLDELAIALRNADDGQAELELADGTRIKGSDMKINGYVEVKSKEGVYSEDELYQKMGEWLKRQIQDGTVSD